MLVARPLPSFNNDVIDGGLLHWASSIIDHMFSQCENEQVKCILGWSWVPVRTGNCNGKTTPLPSKYVVIALKAAKWYKH